MPSLITFSLSSPSFLPSFILCWWFLSGGSFAPQGSFGHVSRHVWFSQLVAAIAISWVEASDATKYHTVHVTAHPFLLTTKTYSNQNINSAKVEKA